jgi:hypothetical protein
VLEHGKEPARRAALQPRLGVRVGGLIGDLFETGTVSHAIRHGQDSSSVEDRVVARPRGSCRRG